MKSSKGSDRQIQLAITAQKSVSLQFEAAGRDAQTYSKELYLWGQEAPEDIKDGEYSASCFRVLGLSVSNFETLDFLIMRAIFLSVTDRLAYLNFVHGSLNTDLANRLDTARGPWKTARATESTAGTLRQAGQATEAVAGESEVEKRNALKLGEAARWKAIREVSLHF